MTAKITAAECDLLRFQADTEEMLRRGSPLWMDWLPAEVKPVALCVPHRDSNGELRVCISDGGASPLLSLVSLDLTDATGRVHLTWWMAKFLGLAPSCLQAMFTPLRDLTPVWGGVAWLLDADPEVKLLLCEPSGPDGSSLSSATFGSVPTTQDYGGPRRLHVPSLANLDSNDPRLLPDGSRLVDALALSLVGRHLLAGGGR